MFLEFLQKSFIFIAFVFAILLILRECGITKKLSPMRASDYVSVIAIFMVLYVISAILLVIFHYYFGVKITMLLFAIIPFAIGKAANYKEIKTYSIIQILCVILSIVYALSNYYF